MRECLTDTDIFSYCMRDIPNVVTHAEEYLRYFRRFNISSLTVSESIIFSDWADMHNLSSPVGTSENSPAIHCRAGHS